MSSISEPSSSGSSVEFFRERYKPLSIFLGCINSIMYGFNEWLNDKREERILAQIRRLDLVGQVEWDIRLNKIGKTKFSDYSDLYDHDNSWKKQLIAIFQGEAVNPKVIQNTMQILERDISSHLNQEPSVARGSVLWHNGWVEIYRNWLLKLQEILSRSLNDKESQQHAATS